MGGAYKGCDELLEVNPGFDTSGLIPRTMLVLHEPQLLTRDGEEPLLVEHVPVARARSQQHECLVRRLVRHLRTRGVTPASAIRRSQVRVLGGSLLKCP